MENKRHYKDVLLKKIDLVTFFGFTKPTLYTWQCDNGFEEKQKNLFGHLVALIQKMKCSLIETLCRWDVY